MSLLDKLKAVVKSVGAVDVTKPPSSAEQELVSTHHEESQAEFFTRKNDLQKEYVAEETVISSSNLSSFQIPKWKFLEPYKGYMITTNHEDDIQDWKDLIDQGTTIGLYTIEYWKKYFDKTIKQDPNDDQPWASVDKKTGEVLHDVTDMQQMMKELKQWPEAKKDEKETTADYTTGMKKLKKNGS